MEVCSTVAPVMAASSCLSRFHKMLGSSWLLSHTASIGPSQFKK